MDFWKGPRIIGFHRRPGPVERLAPETKKRLHEESVRIWEIQIAAYRRDPRDFDLAALAKASDGLTGAEIESVFVEALYRAFDAGKEPTDLVIAEVLTGFVPLSKLMGEQIAGLRNWAKGRARMATSGTPGKEGRLRKIAA